MGIQINRRNQAKDAAAQALAQRMQNAKHRMIETPNMAEQKREEERKAAAKKPETVLHFGYYFG